MNKKEIAMLFKRIRRHYSQFEVDQVDLMEWTRLLQGADPDEINANLDDHIQASEWPPKIANLLGRSSEASMYYDSLREGTAERFQQLEEWEKKAVPPPAALKERVRQLAASRKA